MPEFWYKALAGTGEVQQGWMTAPDEREVEDRLRAGGSFLIEAKAKERPEAKSTRTDGEVPRKQLIAFVEYLASSVTVGMPLLTTLGDIETRVESKRLRKIIAEIRHAVSEEGKSLSEALAEHPKAFPSLYVATIQAGEASGRLDFVLAQLVEHLDWQESISGQVRQATTYPVIVLVAIMGLLTVLVGFVFPRIIPVLEGRSATLPLATRIVMGASEFIREDGIFVVGAFAAGGVVWLLARRTEGFRYWLDTVKLGLPVFGNLAREVGMSRLVTYLGLFYRSGVEIILALTLVEDLLSNRVVAASVRSVRQAVEDGETMANAFGRDPLFPPVVVRSVALGEATGQLDESLARVATYYAREIPITVRRLITALQPMLILVMGGMVLLVALAMILPILSIYQSVGVRR